MPLVNETDIHCVLKPWKETWGSRICWGMVGWAYGWVPVHCVAPQGTGKYSQAALATHRPPFREITFAQPNTRDRMGNAWRVTCFPDSCVMLGLEQALKRSLSRWKRCFTLGSHTNSYNGLQLPGVGAERVGCPLSSYPVGPCGSADQVQSDGCLLSACLSLHCKKELAVQRRTEYFPMNQRSTKVG